MGKTLVWLGVIIILVGAYLSFSPVLQYVDYRDTGVETSGPVWKRPPPLTQAEIDVVARQVSVALETLTDREAGHIKYYGMATQWLLVVGGLTTILSGLLEQGAFGPAARKFALWGIAAMGIATALATPAVKYFDGRANVAAGCVATLRAERDVAIDSLAQETNKTAALAILGDLENAAGRCIA